MSELFRLIIFVAVFLLLQTLFYLGVEIFEGEPHDVERPIDKRIPVIPAFTFIYVTWYPLIAIVPILLYYTDGMMFLIYMGAVIVDIIISLLAYLIYPTSFTRPPCENKGLNLVYKMSFKQMNCAPSMHCSMSYIAIAAALACPGLSLPIRLIIVIDALLITASTLFTKQHVVIDALTALPCALLSAAAGYGLYSLGLMNGLLKLIGGF